MEIALIIARMLSFIMPWALPASVMLLVISAVVDVFKRKFHWSKFALIFLVVTIILLIIQIRLIYFVTGDILNNP